MSIGACAIMDANAAKIGNCIVESAFGGDIMVVGIVLFLIFGILMWKARFPIELALPTGIGLAFCLMAMQPGFVAWEMLYMGGALAAGALIVLMVIRYAKR